MITYFKTRGEGAESIKMIIRMSETSRFNIDKFSEVLGLRGIIIITIITKNYIAHIQEGKINRQIESDAHKKVDLTNV